MENTNLTKRVNRILKYSPNAEQAALNMLHENIGFDIAIRSNPKGVLKLLKNCVKKGEAYSHIWPLQFMFEDGKLPIPEEYQDEYEKAIQELSSRLRFVPNEYENEVSAESLWLDDEFDKMTPEEFADRDIIDVDEPTDNKGNSKKP